jgi:hypothetical protein
VALLSRAVLCCRIKTPEVSEFLRQLKEACIGEQCESHDTVENTCRDEDDEDDDINNSDDDIFVGNNATTKSLVAQSTFNKFFHSTTDNGSQTVDKSYPDNDLFNDKAFKVLLRGDIPISIVVCSTSRLC